jgi:tRNA A-37 threonylcarbamoyl transferase component Bud32
MFTGLVLFQIAFLWLWTRQYKPILQLLRNHNILFTKVFQSLANSGNVNIGPELRAALLEYTTNTSYEDADIDYDALDQLEKNYNIQIDRRVINSGMIALVMRTTDGRIIKLKRRGIEARLTADCQSLKALYNFAAWLAPRNIYVRLLKPCMNNIDDIVAQTDFATEIRNLRQAKEDFAPLDFIQIPTVYNYPDANPAAIIMEHINGSHTLPDDTPEAARIQYMEQFCTFISFGFMYNAIQHTDLHSGNILFTPTGLGIIDYGMAIQLADDLHEAILTIVSTIKGDKQLHEIDFIDTFKNIFLPPLPEHIENRAAIEDICISIAQPLLDAIDMDELNLMDNIEQLSAQLGHPISFHPQCYKIILLFSMMGEKRVIMGPYCCPKTLRAAEVRGLKRALRIIF